MRTVFVCIDRDTGAVRTFGSVAALSDTMGVSKHTLYDHFSRLKELEYSNRDFRIVKTRLESA